MAWAALGKGLMGAGRVVGGAARAAGGGARMARRIFKRKGGKNAPEKPASEQTVDVEAQEVNVRPRSSLIPLAAGGAIVASQNSTSPPTSGEDVEEIALRINTNLIDVKKLLKGSAAYKERVREEQRKKEEKKRAADAENKLEKDKPKTKNKFKLPVPKVVRSFWDKIKDFLMKVFIAQFLDQILNMRGPLINVFKFLAKAADIALNIIGWIFNLVVTIVDGAYKVIDGMRGLVKNIFGDKGLEIFDSFLNTMVKVINFLGSAAMIISVVASALGASSWAGLFGGGAAATTATTAAATTATTGGAAATAGGIGAGAAAGIVAGAGLLASGLGEGIFQLGKRGYNIEQDWRQKADSKGWWNPMKYWWGISAGIMGIINRIFSLIGGILDIVGAPFRMIIELIRYPFLDEAGKKKQRENLVKYDTRIREQFRKVVNAVDIFGVVSDDKGSWGSIYGDVEGEKASKEMFGNDRSTSVTPVSTTGSDTSTSVTPVSTTGSDTSVTKNQEVKSSKPQGLWRGITGAADFVTGGIWDFDQRNREGAPKDWGIRRIVGGVADWATMGLTDFDKRGAGVLQFNPIFGGKDKAWGSRNEQAKRREKQSGFGLKRAIGGFADFATFGMFDFDKQNRRGAPKGFGLKRIAGGLADFVTAGATDFDRRGTGIGQMKLGEIMSNRKAREAYENNPRVQSFRNRSISSQQNVTNRWDMETGKLYINGKEVSSEEYANFMSLSKEERLAKYGSPNVDVPVLGNQAVKFDHEVLRSYAKYEQQGIPSGQPEVIIVNKETTTPFVVHGSDKIMHVSDESTVSTEESYASYQGH